MRNKINNTTLLIVFVALLVLTVILFSGNNGHRERSFDKDILNFKTEDISEVKLYPKSMNGESFRVVRDDEQWIIESGNERYNANADMVNSMLTTLETLDVESLVANSKERWKKYEVTDSLGSRVQLIDGGDVIADLYIGKFKFSQPRSMSTYVRLADEDETFKVNGFLSSTFNREVNDLRDKTLVDDNIANWTKLMFDYPSDSSFVLEKVGEKWLLDGGIADSASVATYIKSVKQLDGRTIDDVQDGDVMKQYRLTIERQNLDAVVLDLGLAGSEQVVSSSENNDVWISDKDIIEKLFVPRSEFAVQ